MAKNVDSTWESIFCAEVPLHKTCDNVQWSFQRRFLKSPVHAISVFFLVLSHHFTAMLNNHVPSGGYWSYVTSPA
jgi:hypothetical protein